MNELITKELLKSWEACKNGFDKFNELFPNGATLEQAMAGLDAAGDGFGCKDHDDWSYWLFKKCQHNKVFKELTASGYRNSGYRNSGDRNSGDRNSGDRNSGNNNSGDRNSGDNNSGYKNSGYKNSGYRNSGDNNSGNRNSGDNNTGYNNTGYNNSGNNNTGYNNSGNNNSGNNNTGFFNSQTPTSIMVFNRPCDIKTFECYKFPRFVHFDLAYWVDASKMTEAEKIADPNFYLRGGQLKTKNYKEAFIESYEKSDKTDRARIKDCPNFDADVFFEISGIDLR